MRSRRPTKKEIRKHRFNCPKLQEIVNAKIEYTSFYSDQLFSPTHQQTSSIEECDGISRCGIANRTGPRLTFDWLSCPLYVQLFE